MYCILQVPDKSIKEHQQRASGSGVSFKHFGTFVFPKNKNLKKISGNAISMYHYSFLHYNDTNQSFKIVGEYLYKIFKK